MDKNLLLSRGFKSKKQLLEFLDNCTDENWKKELSEFYGLPYEDESKDEKDDDLTLDFDDEDEEEAPKKTSSMFKKSGGIKKRQPVENSAKALFRKKSDD